MIIIALGSNLNGVFGTPHQSICRAINQLVASGIKIKDASRLYRTRAYGCNPQPDFLNAIVTAHTALPAYALLEILKRIEAQAGRCEAKDSQRWKARPLDLDIVCYKDVVYNWKMQKPVEGMRVILPHPRTHERAFVLQPLSDVAPFWHHPVFGLTASEFLKRPAVRQTGKILSAGDFLREFPS
jgi:2-amino-4-hydroxy-6-hydroxymethyldihydropteridine diphosphokinase